MSETTEQPITLSAGQSMVQRNPYVLALYGLSALLGIAALIIQRVGVSRALISGGMDSESGVFTGQVFDTATLWQFNFVAILFLLLGLVVLTATLVIQAAKWKPVNA